MRKPIIDPTEPGGIDRRGFLECMAWAGTGVLWTIQGGIATSRAFGNTKHPAKGDLTFVQISDSHIGFNQAANRDVTGTLLAAVQKINELPQTPEFLIHTGDLSHTAKAAEFDTMDQVLGQAKPRQVFYVPGEHDVAGDEGKQYLERYGKGTEGRGWYSFDHKGVHFLGLVNVGIEGRLGRLGSEQLAWIESDLQARSSSTPIVVFAHVPLWTVYPQWNWGTDSGAQVLAALRRFGSVTVLNGHIPQVMQKVEGRVAFHTAMSTAFPQPAPGTAPSPGPMTVPAERLRHLLGITSVEYVARKHSLATVDSPLEAGETPV